MEELLLLVVLLCGPVAIGYLLCCVYPIEAVRRLLGAKPAAPPPGEDLRQALRLALRAPASASDVDLVAALFDLRREAGRFRPCLKAVVSLLGDLVPKVTDPDAARALRLVQDQLQELSRLARDVGDAP